ncbi:MAG: HigA family addiction module antitoxin [Dehalococcoidia bacterium]
MLHRRPAEVFPPGDHIRDEIDARGWTEADLGTALGLSPAALADVLDGHRSITAQLATGLGRAFGTSAELWLNLDARYRLHM